MKQNLGWKNKMERKINTVVELCAQLAEQENLGVTAYASARTVTFNDNSEPSLSGAGGITAVSALVGGILGGRIGFIVGGAIGTVISLSLSEPELKSIPQMIRDLTPEQRRKLFNLLSEFLRDIVITGVTSLMEYLASNVVVKNNVLSALKRFLNDDMKLTI